MRYLFLIIAFILVTSETALAQKDTLKRYHLDVGVGYFADITQFLNPGFNEPQFVKVNPDVLGKIYNGQNLWIRFGLNLKTGFSLSCYYSLAKTKYEYNDALGLFWDDYLIDTYSYFDILIMKEFNLRNNHFFLGSGILLRNYNHPDIDYEIIPTYNENDEIVDLEIGLPHPYNLKMNDLGLVFNFEYTYRFKNQLSIGISCSTNLIFDIGLETVQISPLIGFVF